MISTGGTLIEATEYLLNRGASEVYACATHPVFAGQAVELIRKSPLKQVVVTDTIPVPVEARDHKIVLVSVAQLFAEAIARIHTDRSVSELFT
jgi:ribose-phosphate pyrophosphokinase